MNMYDKFRIGPCQKVNLKKVSPDEHDYGWNDSFDIAKKLEENHKKIFDLQFRLYAEGKQSLLIVLQALDAAGKDGTINHVLSVMNPQGCRSQSFKVPTPQEAAHDFLWREHCVAPRNGEVVIFNRSHYEDVLVGRIHGGVQKDTLKAHLKYINYFEEILNSNRTTIIKFFLHISCEEQLRRFGDRLNDPEKHWKISENDYKEREFWNDYMTAFEDLFRQCSPDFAPWFVIPSNNKNFRNLAVSEILLHTLEKMNPQIPPSGIDVEEIRKRYHADVVSEEKLDAKKMDAMDKESRQALRRAEKEDSGKDVKSSPAAGGNPLPPADGGAKKKNSRKRGKKEKKRDKK